MSDLEFVGKINPQPFVSLAKEEKMRIEEIKRRIQKVKSELFMQEQMTELTYDRDVQEDY